MSLYPQSKNIKKIAWSAISLFCLVPALAFAQGAGASHQDSADDQMLVRELMHLEAVQARERARATLHHAEDAASAEVSQAGIAPRTGPSLVAIYGTGNRRVAQVDIGGHHYLYVQGHPQAMGRRNPEVGYLLESISKSCVRLQKEQELLTLCLHPDFRKP